MLTDLRTVFGDAHELSSKAILQALMAMEEAPWADLRGKPLDERGLAYRLKQYGVKSKTIRQGSFTPRGYIRGDLIDLWSRYIPATSATSATSATPELASTDEGANVLRVADVLHPAGMRRLCAHCNQGGDDLCDASINGHPILLHEQCKGQFRVAH